MTFYRRDAETQRARKKTHFYSLRLRVSAVKIVLMSIELPKALFAGKAAIVTGASRVDDPVAYPILRKPVDVRAVLARLQRRASVAAVRPRLLLVEDDPGVQRATSRMLQRLGIDVAIAANGLEALEALDRVRPSLVVTDLRMPGMSGV